MTPRAADLAVSIRSATLPGPLMMRRCKLATRLLAAASVGAAAMVATRRALGDDLIPRTDIVGNTIVANFNSPTYFINYLLLVVGFPVVTIATFALLGRLRIWSVTPHPRRYDLGPSEPCHAPSWPLRTAFVGSVWGAAAAIPSPFSASATSALFVCVVLAYVLVVWTASASWATRTGLALEPTRAGANLLGATASLAALAVASRASQVSLADTGTTIHYPWPPVWLVAAAVLIALAVVSRRLLASSPDSWHQLERSCLAFIAAPTALVLFTGQLVGDVAHYDLYHDGERLAASRLVGDGAFPWRDLLFIHGLLEDVIMPSISRSVFEDSRWAMFAGRRTIFVPLYWVSSYFLSLFLFRRDLLLVFASQLVVVLGLYTDASERMVLVPALLLSLAALLIRPTWPRALLFTSLGIATTVVTPESAFFVAAAGMVVVAYESTHHGSGERVLDGFRRVAMCVVIGAAAVALGATYLASKDALPAFIGYYTTFSGSHQLTGALPLRHGDAEYTFWAVAPIVLIVAGWAYGAARFARRREVSVQDWVVGASILALIPYYTKFLARADDHVFQVASMALVPLLYLCFRIVAAVEGTVDSVVRRHVRGAPRRLLPVAIIAVVVALSPVWVVRAIADLPERYARTAEHEPLIARVGYDDGALPPALIGGVQRTVDRYLDPGDTMFDFTNSPELFWYLLDQRLATRYYHVSMAIRQRTQTNLIEELEAARPKLVAFDSEKGGLPIWDGITNAVRHYDVSTYLLDHYRPVTEAEGYLFLLRNDVDPEQGADSSLYFATRACDWGSAPAYLSIAPPGPPTHLPIRRSTATAIDAAGWAYDDQGDALPSAVVMAHDAQVVLRVPTGIDRFDVAHALGRSRAADSGFEIAGGVLDDGVQSEDLRPFAIVDGEAAPFGKDLDRPLPARLLNPDGSSIPVRRRPVAGSVDQLRAVAGTSSVELPAAAATSDWMVVEHGELAADEGFALADGSGVPSHRISFRALAGRSTSTQIMVGACAQWRGLAGRTGFLFSDAGAPIPAFGIVDDDSSAPGG